MTEEERWESVRHCRYVDEVVKHAPWACHWEFVQKHKVKFLGIVKCRQHKPYFSFISLNNL